MRVEILDYLHKLFLRLKPGALVIFFLSFSLVAIASSSVYGEGLVPAVETPVKVFFDGKEKSFVATQNTVEGALKQGGIALAQNDIAEPAKGTFLNGTQTQIKVVRALPVLVSDGSQEQLAYTAYSDPAEALKQLNFTIYPEDIVTAGLILDPVDERAVGQKISIRRAPTFSVNVDDGVQVVRSWGKTIGDVLDGKIALGKRDIIEPNLTSSSVNVDSITITRVNVAEIEENLAIPFETIEKKDYNLYQGQSKVTQSGSNGEKKQQVRVTYHNGVEIGRTILSTEIVSNPITKVVSVGVKPIDAGRWWDTLVSASSRYPNNDDITPDKMWRVMVCESGGREAAGGYYKGLFQYSPDTWSGASAAAGYGGASITNGTAQIYVTAWKVNHDGGWYAWGCKP